jgi:outer membrane protein assembly factor BamB
MGRRLWLAAVAAGLATFTLVVAVPSWSAQPINWPSYLFSPAHTSDNTAARSVTVANAASLAPVWTWHPDPPTQTGQPGNQLLASPTVVNGRIYIGANTGVFYALNENAGTVKWKRSLGYQTKRSCGTRGLTSTATVAPDPQNGQLTVYVGGGDGYLYALRASNGAVVWKSLVVDPGTNVNAGYNWASPTVAGGRVFMGMASQCDNPLIPGGEKAFDQRTGALLGTYSTMPQGAVGGSIWSSAASTSDGATVWVTTGNPDEVSNGPAGDAESIVRLNGANMAKQESWQVPSTQRMTDTDFGASPTLFTATVGSVSQVPLVAACNKNGLFYAWRRSNLSAGPVWTTRVAAGGESANAGCIDPAAWDATRGKLFVGAGTTTINGTAYPGSIQEVDAGTGVVNWRVPLDAAVEGAPSLDGAGLLAVPVYGTGTSEVDLLDAATGRVVTKLPVTGPVFSQPVFADGYLFVASLPGTLTAFTP